MHSPPPSYGGGGPKGRRGKAPVEATADFRSWSSTSSLGPAPSAPYDGAPPPYDGGGMIYEKWQATEWSPDRCASGGAFSAQIGNCAIGQRALNGQPPPVASGLVTSVPCARRRRSGSALVSG